MDEYIIDKVIGEGSFGRALLVHSKSCHNYVMKEIQLPKTQLKMENSRREAVLLSRMKHPNIVAFWDSFEAGGHLYIVMEYCVGGDLLQRIQLQKSTLFSQDTILKWFAQMCAGAKHVHDKRVLHRDLKSKNIFLTDTGTVKLGDFGSACVLNSARAHAHTYVGTPYYVSPEIWDNKPYNNKSDVWSLGCVLYELCTLRHPFQAPSWKALILKVCRGAYPPLPQHLPYELHYLVKHMFKTNPKDRPSLRTILTSHRISRLLQRHLPSAELKEEEEERVGQKKRWRREEGEKVAAMLGQKSLMTESTSQGVEESEGCGASCAPPPRQQWAQGPPETLLRVLGNADLLSSEEGSCAGPPQSRQRRRWDRGPPERLLSLLEKAPLCQAFRTFSIHREGDNPLVGPLSRAAGDDPDGPEVEEEEEEEAEAERDRLEPRSDDEDTDFEEESPCAWIDELERMSLEH